MDAVRTLVNDTELQDRLDSLRQWGRLSKLIRLEPPALPRSRRLRRALEREAESDHRVRRALDAAIRAEQTRPNKLIRRFYRDADITIH